MKAIKDLKTKIMKREKKVKTIPTKEELQLEVKRYLDRSSEHIFLKKAAWYKEYKDDHFKVIPVELEGKLYYISITMNANAATINISGTDWVATKNSLGMFKDWIFPGYYKHKSIKGYIGKEVIKMNSLFYEIGLIAKITPGITKDELEGEIKKKVDYYYKWKELKNKKNED